MTANDIDILEGIPFHLISRPGSNLLELNLPDPKASAIGFHSEMGAVAPTVREAVALIVEAHVLPQDWRDTLRKRLALPPTPPPRFRPSVTTVIERVKCHPRAMAPLYGNDTPESLLNNSLATLLWFFDGAGSPNIPFMELRAVMSGAARLCGAGTNDGVRELGALMIARIRSLTTTKGAFEHWNPTRPEVEHRINAKIDLVNAVLEGKRGHSALRLTLVDLCNYAAWLAWHVWPPARPLQPLEIDEI